MQQALKILNRYKFTLIYGVVFWLMGGLVLAIPALLGGLIVDKLMSRPDLKTDYPSTKYTFFYYFGFLLFFLIIYPMIAFDSWIELTKPFADGMAKFVPIIDNYSEQIALRGDESRVPEIRHFYAVFWFVNVVTAPLLFGDIFRYSIFTIKNDFFVNKNVEDVPLSLGQSMNLDHIKIKRISPDNLKGILLINLYVLVMFFVFLWAGSWLFNYSYWGDQNLGDYVYGRNRYVFSPLFVPINFFMALLGFLGLVGGNIRLFRLRKLNRINNELSGTS